MALRAKSAKGATTKETRRAARSVSAENLSGVQNTVSEAVSLNVRAIALGYYGAQLREEGDTFELREAEHFSSSWMKRI